VLTASILGPTGQPVQRHRRARATSTAVFSWQEVASVRAGGRSPGI